MNAYRIKIFLGIIVFLFVAKYFIIQNAKSEKDGNNHDILKVEDQVRYEGDENGFQTQTVRGNGRTRIDGSQNVIHLAFSVCGNRLPETIVLLKSAVLSTSSSLVVHIFLEKQLRQPFKDSLEAWPHRYRSLITYFMYDVKFPEGKDNNQWRELFLPCASQRLFIPELIKDVDSVIYLDTDILLTAPIEQLYHYFSMFNSTQMVAVGPSTEDIRLGWYNNHAKVPFYGPHGLNSGILLMNLTRLRQSTWLPSMLKYFKEYRSKIVFGDQDLINIYFHFSPHQLFLLSCDWNYRCDLCERWSVCEKADQDGVKILHANKRTFFSGKQPAFQAVYETMKDHPFTADLQTLANKIDESLKSTVHTKCGKLAYEYKIFTKYFTSV